MMSDESALEKGDLSHILRRLHEVFREQNGRDYVYEAAVELKQEDGYSVPKKTAKRARKESIEENVKTGNRYEALSDAEGSDEQDEQDMITDGDNEDDMVIEKAITKRPTKTAKMTMTKTATDNTQLTAKTPNTQHQTMTETKDMKVTPIIIRDKSKWTALSSKLTELKINFNKARLIQTGI